VLIEEPESERFRISQQGISVVDEQLREVSNLSDYISRDQHSFTVSNLPSDDLKELHTVKVTYSPFKVE